VGQNKLYYLELKSGHGDTGPAWISHVQASKSGRTLYFNGRALKRLVGGGISGNYYCLETNDEYWVSGVKKNGQDRHWAGSGPVMIDSRAVADYLKYRGIDRLDPTQHTVVTDIKETDISRLGDLENKTL